MDNDGIAAAIHAVDSTLRRCVSVPIRSEAALDSHPERALCGTSTTAATWMNPFSPFALALPPVTPSAVVAAPGGVPSTALHGVDRAITIDRVWNVMRATGAPNGREPGGGDSAANAMTGVCPFASSRRSPSLAPSLPGGCPGRSLITTALPPPPDSGCATLGPVVVASSQMYVPTIVEESLVAGLTLWDVSVDKVHPPEMRGRGPDGAHQMRWGRFVYDVPSGVLLTASSHDGGASVYFNSFSAGGEQSTWTSSTVVYERPKKVGAPPLTLPRMSTVWHKGDGTDSSGSSANPTSTMAGMAGVAAAITSSAASDGRPSGVRSPLDAFWSAVLTQTGTYGVGLFLVAEPPNATAATELGVLSLSSRVEASSAAVVARLQNALLSFSVVSASALRVGTPGGRSGGGDDDDGDDGGGGGGGGGGPGDGPGGSNASQVAGANGQTLRLVRRPKERICLDDVVDEATRRRVVRNRESARRSNERRRLARLAARAKGATATAATAPANVREAGDEQMAPSSALSVHERDAGA
ncbi:hypothetical protein MMPV_003455 [Pyropia vietnamensis]